MDSSSSSSSATSGVFLEWILDDVSDKEFAEASKEIANRRETLRIGGAAVLANMQLKSSPSTFVARHYHLVLLSSSFEDIRV